jgi:hypothetical protein
LLEGAAPHHQSVQGAELSVGEQRIFSQAEILRK